MVYVDLFQNAFVSAVIMSSGDELCLRGGPVVDSDAPVVDFFGESGGEESVELPRETFGGRSGELPRIGTGFGEVDATVEECVNVDVVGGGSGDDSGDDRDDPDFLANQYGEYISVI